RFCAVCKGALAPGLVQRRGADREARRAIGREHGELPAECLQTAADRRSDGSRRRCRLQGVDDRAAGLLVGKPGNRAPQRSRVRDAAAMLAERGRRQAETGRDGIAGAGQPIEGRSLPTQVGRADRRGAQADGERMSSRRRRRGWHARSPCGAARDALAQSSNPARRIAMRSHATTPHNPAMARSSPEPTTYWTRRLAAEVVGTFALTMVAVGADIAGRLSGGEVGSAARAVAPALLVAAMIY